MSIKMHVTLVTFVFKCAKQIEGIKLDDVFNKMHWHILSISKEN